MLISCATDQRTLTSFQPGQVWPDNRGIHINAHGGGILFFQNKYYWYGEHKIEGEPGNSAQVGVHVYSSRDLYNWIDEGIALKVDEESSGSEIARGCILERPKVIYNEMTGKFVMWFHLELKGMGYDAARSGVAVSDKPTGPFKFINSFRPNAGYWPVNVQDFHKLPVADTIKEKYCGGLGCLPAHVDSMNILGRDFARGQMARDMNLFVDDNGKPITCTHLRRTAQLISLNSRMTIFLIREDMPVHSPTGTWKLPQFVKPAMGFTILLVPTAQAGIRMRPGLLFPTIFSDHGWNWAIRVLARIHPQPSILKAHSYCLFRGKKDAFIFMADRWTPENPIDGKYIWLPLRFSDDRILLEWKDDWDLNDFK